MDGDTFSARWEGRFRSPVTGAVTFTAEVDDGVRLWIDGTLIIDRWLVQPGAYSATVSMVAGKKYDIRVEYFENLGDATARLYWTYPGQAKQIIPASAFTHFEVPLKAGLQVDYFEGAAREGGLWRLASPEITATDVKVDSAWGSSSPKGLTSPDTFGAVWTGKIKVPTSGNYKFAVRGDDAMQLWGKQCLRGGQLGSSRTRQVPRV